MRIVSVVEAVLFVMVTIYVVGGLKTDGVPEMTPVNGLNTKPVGSGLLMTMLPMTPFITGIKGGFVWPEINKSTPV